MESNDAEEREVLQETHFVELHIYSARFTRSFLYRWVDGNTVFVQRCNAEVSFLNILSALQLQRNVNQLMETLISRDIFFFDIFSIGECLLSILISFQVPIARKLCQTFILFPENRTYALAQCNKPYWKRIFVNLILSVSREGKQKSS